MPLVLQKTIREMSREEFEAFLEQVRFTRMAAAIEYHAAKQAKQSKHKSKLDMRLERHYEMLEKDMDKLMRAEEALEDRLTRIEEVKQEMETVDDYS